MISADGFSGSPLIRSADGKVLGVLKGGSRTGNAPRGFLCCDGADCIRSCLVAPPGAKNPHPDSSKSIHVPSRRPGFRLAGRRCSCPARQFRSPVPFSIRLGGCGELPLAATDLRLILSRGAGLPGLVWRMQEGGAGDLPGLPLAPWSHGGCPVTKSWPRFAGCLLAPATLPGFRRPCFPV